MHTGGHRRRRVPRALAVAVVLAVSGCTGAAEPVASATCDAPQRPRLQEGSHLIGDTAPPVPYSSTPPTSGWHGSGAPPAPGVFGTPVSEADQVSFLEGGGIVVTFTPEVATEVAEPLTQVTADEDLRGLVLATPYDGDVPRPVTLAAWGVLQRCDAIDLATVRSFVEAYEGGGEPD